MKRSVGQVQAHTIIRVPDKAHAGQEPFVLLLVHLDDGSRVLGHFAGNVPPKIGSRVSGCALHNETIVFHEERHEA